MTATKDKVQELIQRAKLSLLIEEPFYGTISAKVDWIETEEMPTCATDGKRIFWNRKFLGSLGNFDSEHCEAVTFVIVHEIHHIIKRHHMRMGSRDAQLWNIATDFQINGELDNFLNNHMSIPRALADNICLDHRYDGWVEEKIYDDLLNNNNPNVKVTFQSFGDVMPNKDGSTPEQQNAELDKLVQEAAVRAKRAGKVPGGLEKFIFSEKDAQVNWKQALAAFVEAVNYSHMRWNPPHKRLMAHNILFPSLAKDGVGELAFGIDTSGSIGRDEINNFFAELAFVFNKVKPSKLHLLYFTSEIWRYDLFNRYDQIKIPAEISSGGTHFQAVNEYISSHNIKPKCLIMLTDMECEIPTKPNYPVIWCSLNRNVQKPPYGKMVYIDVLHKGV